MGCVWEFFVWGACDVYERCCVVLCRVCMRGVV